MSGMFYGADLFNQDISSWDVSEVTDMSSIFERATRFNQDISSWDTSRVTDIGYMFYDAESFNQPFCWNLTKKEHEQYLTGTKGGSELNKWTVETGCKEKEPDWGLILSLLAASLVFIILVVLLLNNLRREAHHSNNNRSSSHSKQNDDANIKTKDAIQDTEVLTM
mmetsp:Transcript_18700/g.22836  ORF Transcript_18700/g.22836 Transcript_18700/m.22836 type:complete len:166 (+) Transcript_18700:687-1184(+)